MTYSDLVETFYNYDLNPLKGFSEIIATRNDKGQLYPPLFHWLESFIRTAGC